ncbi:HTH domain-containing protein [Pseudobutyrivibrio sp.]|uniref:HTH domain-containing protein n=1 Tax=Pseudobutyrivibrio sp. TaxID=2014367 RepID=UPI0038697797
MTRKKCVYSDEQVKILEQNPYTYSVTNSKLVVTLAFKEFFMTQVNKPGMTCPKILKAAGYDPKMFSRGAMDQLRNRILSEAASPEGLKAPRGLSQAEKIKVFAEKDLDNQRTSTSIKELQSRVVHLEQQVEFLKKISNVLHPPES